ncbi:DUF4352 domain-containing protein [Shimazuella alba]|uniref:DUF4352 domain-containing protein n=1 Tax=Shimazuella alba TaxID=2690964 RepID=A0A6I4VWL8_9BACL|nr:DUF4352 domain-containing protein [Shimazuella alba]MXQ52392.1 DUF4352 domain-containing protein [Shimazuella alba]
MMDFIMDAIISMTVIFGLFLLVGVIYPTSSHREIRLHNRWGSFVLLLGVVFFYQIMEDISIKQILIDIVDGISVFFFFGIVKLTSWHRKIKLNKHWINFCLFVFFILLSIGIGGGESKLGEPVDIFDRIYTVNNVTELQQIKDLKGTDYSPNKGARFIKVNVSLKNHGTKPITIPSDEITLHAYTKKYSEYKRDVTNEVLVNPSKVSLFQELNPGVTITANVLFVVPNNIPLNNLEVSIEKKDIQQDIPFNGDVSKWPVVVLYMVIIIGLIEVFLLIGVVYPTGLHRDIKLDSRWTNLFAFSIGLFIILSLAIFTRY